MTTSILSLCRRGFAALQRSAAPLPQKRIDPAQMHLLQALRASTQCRPDLPKGSAWILDIVNRDYHLKAAMAADCETPDPVLQYHGGMRGLLHAIGTASPWVDAMPSGPNQADLSALLDDLRQKAQTGTEACTDAYHAAEATVTPRSSYNQRVSSHLIGVRPHPLKRSRTPQPQHPRHGGDTFVSTLMAHQRHAADDVVHALRALAHERYQLQLALEMPAEPRVCAGQRREGGQESLSDALADIKRALQELAVLKPGVRPPVEAFLHTLASDIGAALVHWQWVLASSGSAETPGLLALARSWLGENDRVVVLHREALRLRNPQGGTGMSAITWDRLAGTPSAGQSLQPLRRAAFGHEPALTETVLSLPVEVY